MLECLSSYIFTGTIALNACLMFDNKNLFFQESVLSLEHNLGFDIYGIVLLFLLSAHGIIRQLATPIEVSDAGAIFCLANAKNFNSFVHVTTF